MENNIEISADQNTITSGELKFTFVESNVDTCTVCALYSDKLCDDLDAKLILWSICNIAPCAPALRRDEKNGVFK